MATAAPTPHTDIRARDGWVARLPAPWRPYALLARLDRPIGSWLLALPGLWAFAVAAPTVPDALRLSLLFGIGAVAARGAGCVANDLWDRDLDRRVARTAGRPLASGAVGTRGALAALAVLLLVALLVMLQLPPAAMVLCALSVPLCALYPLAKRVTGWPQAALGVVFSWAAPAGWAAATGEWPGAAALALWAAGFCWILGYDTIYAQQDAADDAIVGVRSSALTLGPGRVRPFLAATYAATVALWALAGWLAGLSWPAFAALALPAALLARQVAAFDAADPARCLALFRANREVGLAAALALALGRL